MRNQGVFDGTLPLERARTIPSEWYYSPTFARSEADRVFARAWHFAARLDQLRRPGDFVTTMIAGEPVALICQPDGSIKGMVNVCRHRAAILLNEPCGHVTKIRCRYHGWTYDTAGCLKGMPEFEGVEEFERDDNALPNVSVETWGQFVFACLERPQVSLKEFLSPLPDWSVSRGLDSLHFARRVSYELRCNWKVAVDNYLDGGYHVNYVHPELAGVLDYTQYKTETFSKGSVQTSPIVPGNPDEPAGRTRTGTEAAYWWIYPNWMVNVYAGVMDTNLVEPIAPDRCRVTLDYYFADGTNADFIEQSISVADRVQREDNGICEEVQIGLGSRSYSTGRFSVKRENGAYHFHRLLAADLQPG